MSVQVHLNRVEPWEASTGVDAGLLERAVRATLEEAATSPEGELSVTLVDSDDMAALNAEWFGREGLTDVVAFDLGGEEGLLGDVYVCPRVALEAVEAGEAPNSREELVRLVIHGTLHVLGHDHPEGPERWESAMYALQERLVTRVLAPEEPGPARP